MIQEIAKLEKWVEKAEGKKEGRSQERIREPLEDESTLSNLSISSFLWLYKDKVDPQTHL